MRATLRLIVAAAVLVASVSMVAVAPAAAQSDGTLSLSVSTSADSVEPGEELTISYTIENTGDETTGVVLDVTGVPDGWSVAEHSDDGATWRDDQKWLYQTVESGSSVEPSVTYTVPDDASGEFTVGGNATTSASSSTTAETTVTVGDSANATATATSGGSGPGFGAAVTVVAVLAVALLVHRRD